MSLVRNSGISYPLCPHPLRSQTETSAYFLKVKYKFQKSNLNFGELKQKNSKSPENTILLCAKQWIWKINQQLEKPERKQQLPFWTTLSVFANPLQPAEQQRLRLCTPAKRPSCARAPQRTLVATLPRWVFPTPAGRDARSESSVQRLNKFCSPLQQAL